ATRRRTWIVRGAGSCVRRTRIIVSRAGQNWPARRPLRNRARGLLLRDSSRGWRGGDGGSSVRSCADGHGRSHLILVQDRQKVGMGLAKFGRARQKAIHRRFLLLELVDDLLGRVLHG